MKSLEEKCPHYPYGNALGFQCEICIRKFIETNTEEEIKIQLEKYSQLNVASERIARILKNYKQNKRIED